MYIYVPLSLSHFRLKPLTSATVFVILGFKTQETNFEYLILLLATYFALHCMKHPASGFFVSGFQRFKREVMFQIFRCCSMHNSGLMSRSHLLGLVIISRLQQITRSPATEVTMPFSAVHRWVAKVLLLLLQLVLSDIILPGFLYAYNRDYE